MDLARVMVAFGSATPTMDSQVAARAEDAQEISKTAKAENVGTRCMAVLLFLGTAFHCKHCGGESGSAVKPATKETR
jgi:hypothetical protein